MLVIDNVIVSHELISTFFACDINKCKGICCRCGDSGAGITVSEVDEIHANLGIIAEGMSEKAINSIRENDIKVWDYDPIGRLVTLLQKSSECVFGYYEESVLYCAIEKSFRDNKIAFNKPISCHLYPVKYQKFEDFEVLSLHKWDICEPAFENGKKLGVFVYEFAKDSLIRKFGMEWYKKLLTEIEKLRSSKD